MPVGKLTPKQVLEIREARKRKETLQVIGDRYGVTRERIRQICDTTKPYVKYDKLQLGADIPELAYIKSKLEKPCEKCGTMKSARRLTAADLTEIAYRYAQGIARVKPYVTRNHIAKYLGVSVCQFTRAIVRRNTTPMADQIKREARA